MGRPVADHRCYWLCSQSPVCEKGRRRASLLQEELDGPGWTVREDTKLLDAVEMFGFGNWKDIAKHVESKTDVQVKERYTKVAIICDAVIPCRVILS